MDFGTPFAQVRIPVRDLISPDFCSHYTTGEKIIRWPENYAAVEILSGGGIIIRGWRGRAKNSKEEIFEKISKCPKLWHNAKNILFHILIRCETIP